MKVTRCLGGLLVATLLLVAAGPTSGQQPKAPNKDKTDKTDKEKASNGGEVKVFDLAHADPEAVRQTLTTILETRRGTLPGPLPRIATSPRTKALFVRGGDKEIEVVAELIRILDTAPGAPLPESKTMHIVRLKHAKAPEVFQVLTNLGLQTQVVPLTHINSLLVEKKGDSKEILGVLEKLDVEIRPAKRPAETKSSEKKPSEKKPSEKVPSEG
jgi:hypothetical protein